MKEPNDDDDDSSNNTNNIEESKEFAPLPPLSNDERPSTNYLPAFGFGLRAPM